MGQLREEISSSVCTKTRQNTREDEKTVFKTVQAYASRVMSDTLKSPYADL